MSLIKFVIYVYIYLIIINFFLKNSYLRYLNMVVVTFIFLYYSWLGVFMYLKFGRILCHFTIFLDFKSLYKSFINGTYFYGSFPMKRVNLNFDLDIYSGYFTDWSGLKDLSSNIPNILFDLNINYNVDGLSVLFVWLTVLIHILLIGYTWNEKNSFRELNVLLILLIFFVIQVFLISDLLVFFFFFELILIPMFILIGFWGSRYRKVSASYKFFIYTLFGSIFLLFSIIYIYIYSGTTELYNLRESFFTDNIQIILWFFFFIAFSLKVPIFPFHTWLPEAHAEAPTVGSIILAGLLLKIGPYGFLRFSNVLFPIGLLFFKPLVYMFCIIGIIYTSFSAIRQVDIKKIIAYSSIGHMGYVILGLLSDTLEGIQGSIMLMVAHGFVSSGLFLMIGLIYERYGSRILTYLGGIYQVNPLMGSFFFFFILCNFGFPGSLNFISEFLILLGLFYVNSFLSIMVGFTSVLVVIYNMWLYNRVFLGKFFQKFNKDLGTREIILILLLILPVLIGGLFSKSLSLLIGTNILYRF